MARARFVSGCGRRFGFGGTAAAPGPPPDAPLVCASYVSPARGEWAGAGILITECGGLAAPRPPPAGKEGNGNEVDGHD